MKLQTPVEISQSKTQIRTTDHILVMGSCFATNIGEALIRLRLNVSSNPYGVLYNSISILNSLRARRLSRKYTADDLVLHDGLYHSMDHHGSFSDPEPQEVLEKINQTPSHDPDILIVTLGTAWIYKYQNQTVANCHKLPSSLFSRERLGYNETLDSLKQIAQIYPEAQKIFTLSPIRHIKDGLQENSRSKATLRCAIAEVVDNDPMCHYFPSYEILMDQLRDYRFYQSDMLHPSQQAVDYIIERFEECYFDNRLKTYAQELRKITLSLSHKPLHPKTLQYQQFKESLERKIKKFAQNYPEVDISDII